jgi:hypothetical protein
MGWACSEHIGDEKCITIFIGNPEGNSPLGRNRRRCEDNVKMSITEIWLGCGLILLAENGERCGLILLAENGEWCGLILLAENGER